MTTPLEQRVAALESDLYRPGSGLLALYAESLRRPTENLDDFSRLQREVHLAVREITTRLDSLESLIRQVLDRLPSRPEEA